MTIRGFIAAIGRSLRAFLNDSESSNTLDPRQAAQEMLAALDRKADVFALAKTRSDELYDQLQGEIENHAALGRQAEEFLRDGNRELARRSVALQLQCKERIERLTKRYEASQQEAEAAGGDFRGQQAQVKERIDRLPEIEQDARYVRALEQLEPASHGASLAQRVTEFDHLERELRLRERQIRNKQLVEADPDAELDREIRQTIGEKRIDDALAALESKVGEAPVIDAEFTEVSPDDPVARAQKLLEAPRFTGVLQIPARPSSKGRGSYTGSRR